MGGAEGVLKSEFSLIIAAVGQSEGHVSEGFVSLTAVSINSLSAFLAFCCDSVTSKMDLFLNTSETSFFSCARRFPLPWVPVCRLYVLSLAKGVPVVLSALGMATSC